jgi:hypothetical protein
MTSPLQNLVRRIKLKNIGGPFTPELPDFTVHRQTRATATAAYVILEGMEGRHGPHPTPKQ